MPKEIVTGTVNKIKARFAEHPIKTVTALIAVPSALIALVMQGFALYDKIDEYVVDNFVSPQQLKDAEQRITDNFHDESGVILDVYLADLIEQKAKLNELIRKAVSAGEMKYYTIQVETLNTRIETLRGTQ